jgi:uncharacterized protein (TIGR02996 family)
MLTAHHFLSAVLAEPHDDFHRVVFADWLEDNGEPERAEFIRAQVLAWAHGNRDVRVWNDCYKKADSILTAERFLEWLGGPWCRGFKVNVRTSSKVELDDGENRTLQLTVRRGFLVAIRCDCAAWKRFGPQIVAGQPLEEVDVYDVQALGGGCTYTTRHPGLCVNFPWNTTPYHRASARRWPTEEALRVALSIDCLNWAREEAGQPLLAYPEFPK